jgi:hypothetical protein
MTNSLVEDLKVSFRGDISITDYWEVLGTLLLRIDASLSACCCLISLSFSLKAFSLDLMVVNLNLSKWFVDLKPFVLYIIEPRGVINLLDSNLAEKSSSVGDENVLILSPKVVAISDAS